MQPLTSHSCLLLYPFHGNHFLFFSQFFFVLVTHLTCLTSSLCQWRPTQPGYYYYSSGGCENGEKVAVRVIPTPPHSSIAFPPVTAPPPTSGGELPSFPSNGWVSSSPASSLQPELGPSPAPGDSGTGIPFINSNPAVPLPTGETDTATIRPLPITGSGDDASQVCITRPFFFSLLLHLCHCSKETWHLFSFFLFCFFFLSCCCSCVFFSCPFC